MIERRQKMIASAIQKALIIFLKSHQEEDSDFTDCSITHVILTKDGKTATVYFTAPDPKPMENQLLKKKAIFNRHLAHTLQLRKLPTLYFRFDAGAQNAARVEELLKTLKE